MINFTSSPVGAAAGVGTSPIAGGTTAKQKSEAIRSEFDRYANMTPAQRMREALLKKLGVTEDQLKSMSPEDRKAVEDKLADLIKQEMQQQAAKTGKKGLVVDVSA